MSCGEEQIAPSGAPVATMSLDVGEIQEAQSDENTGLFFKYIGAFKAPAGEVGTATALQVAQKNGLLVFRTADGK